MLPINLQQPFIQPFCRKDLISHISSPESPLSTSHPLLSTNHASPIPRLIIDYATLESLINFTNNTFSIQDPCILLKRTLPTPTSSQSDKTIQKLHPLYQLFLQSQHISTPPSSSLFHLDDIIFNDLYNAPHIYLPCLLELSTTTINTIDTQQTQHSPATLLTSVSSITPHVTLLHPDSLHFGLQYSNNDDTDESAQYWLVPIKRHLIPTVSHLIFHTEPRSIAHPQHFTAKLPEPIIPEALLHQLINNSAQKQLSSKQSYIKYNVQPTKFTYSYIISTYSLFSTQSHRINNLINSDKNSFQTSASETTLIHLLPSLQPLSESTTLSPTRSQNTDRIQHPILAQHKLSSLSTVPSLPPLSNSPQILPSFAKWLHSNSLLYLLGHITPPSTTPSLKTQPTTLISIPFTTTFTTPLQPSSVQEGNSLPIFNTNFHSQLGQFIHNTLSLAFTILSLISPVSETSSIPSHIIPQQFLHNSPFFKSYHISSKFQPRQCYALALQHIISTLFSTYTTIRPQHVRFLLINGPVGCGKRDFISHLQSHYYQILLSQLNHTQYFSTNTAINPSTHTYALYPVIVSLHIDQIRSIIFNKQTTSATFPYFTLIPSSSPSSSITNSSLTTEISSDSINITIPTLALEQKQSVVKILDHLLLSLQTSFPNIILHLEQFELWTTLQLASQASSSTSMVNGTDLDYAILNYFMTLKSQFNPPPLSFSSFSSSSPVLVQHNYHTQQRPNSSLVVCATTSVLQPSDHLHPLITDLFDNITHIPALSQNERIQILSKLLTTYNFLTHNNSLSNNNNDTAVNRDHHQLISYIAALTQGSTQFHLELLVNRAALHSQTLSSNISPSTNPPTLTILSLLLATQSIIQLIETNTSQPTNILSTMLPTEQITPTNTSSSLSSNTILIQSAMNIPVDQLITILHPSKQIISLQSYPHLIIYKAYSQVHQLLTILTSHIHILPILQRAVQKIIASKLQTTCPAEATTSISPQSQWLPTGVLLTGSHTSGKTYLVKTLIQQVLKLPCLTITSTDIISSYVGESESNIRNFFAKAQPLRPCVLFFEDIHNIVSGDVHSATKKNRTLQDQFALDALKPNQYRHFDDDYKYLDREDFNGSGNKHTASLLAELIRGLDERNNVGLSTATLASSGQSSAVDNDNNDVHDIHDKSDPIYVIATTTSLSRVPSSLLTKGRFDVNIDMNTPNNTIDSLHTLHPDRCKGNHNGMSIFDLLTDMLTRKLLNKAASDTLPPFTLCPSVYNYPQDKLDMLLTLPTGTLFTFLLMVIQHQRQRILSISPSISIISSLNTTAKTFPDNNERDSDNYQRKQKAMSMLFKSPLSLQSSQTTKGNTNNLSSHNIYSCTCDNQCQVTSQLCLVDFLSAHHNLFTQQQQHQ